MNQRRLVLIWTLTVVLATGISGSLAFAQEKPTEENAAARAPRPRIDAASSLSLEEARIIIEAAVARVRAEKAHAAIAVVDDNGNLVSMDRMDGTSSFFARFAVGKAVGAVALQQTTAESSDQYKVNPQRFLSALSMLQGEILLIRGGFPLIVNGRIVGGVGSAGHGGDGDVEAAKAGIAAWEKFRQSRK
ncbi:MAG TPA: heme-binding protein [Candidatus Binatia bacterium]|jgi:glc operon protein GlcG